MRRETIAVYVRIIQNAQLGIFSSSAITPAVSAGDFRASVRSISVFQCGYGHKLITVVAYSASTCTRVPMRPGADSLLFYEDKLERVCSQTQLCQL